MKRQHWWHEHADQHYTSVRESAASRWKRLAPSWCQDESTPADITATSPAASTIQQPTRGSRSKAQASAAGASSYALQRPDEKIVRHVRRGTAIEAMAALETKGVKALVAALVKDRYSAGATLSNASLVRTWHMFHHQAFAHVIPPLPVLPITVRKLVIIAAMFKVGGYRSYTNYVSVMRSHHLEDGHLWCPLLAHTSGWVTRAVLRGIGPERQSCAFDAKRLFSLPRPSPPMVSHGPSNPLHMTILATLFLMREVEVTTSRIAAWQFNTAAKELTWHLPNSKSDHMALGVYRTLPCFCGLEHVPCAYHTALSHLKWLQSSGHSLDAAAPLFPTVTGTMATKQAAVLTFEQIGLLCGQPLLSEHGLRLFGGHTPRVTGARLYAGAGLEVNKIRILARHQGDTILRYVKEAPLATIRADLGMAARIHQVANAAGPDPRVDEHKRRIKTLETKVSELSRIIEGHVGELAHLQSASRAAPVGDLVQNCATAPYKVHRASTTATGRALCGWSFDGDTYRARRRTPAKAFRIVQSLEGIPADVICERCLPKEHAAALQGDIIHEELSGDEHPVEE